MSIGDNSVNYGTDLYYEDIVNFKAILLSQNTTKRWS